MSFLFDKRSRKAMQWVWAFFGILIILSMVFAFSGGHGFVPQGNPEPVAPEAPFADDGTVIDIVPADIDATGEFTIEEVPLEQ